ncbi:hypothetical protein [Pseudomonas sp. NPDC007930]|uniref:hypothetical protein n=1 Tax=Pseudomonas sp. NPDC007930 TaxID=3364417 RepID=UPI0036E55A2B
MNDQPFRAYDISNVAVNKADPVQSCPSGKVVTGVVFYRDFEAFHAARLECARFQTTNGQALNIGTQQQQNRWVEYDHHNSICERPANQGPTYLLSSANHFMTGLQIESFKTRWSCSEASFTPH